MERHAKMKEIEFELDFSNSAQMSSNSDDTEQNDDKKKHESHLASKIIMISIFLSKFMIIFG